MNVGAHKADVRIATNNARKIQAALRQGIDAKRVIAAYRKSQPNATKNPAADRARARAWAMLNMRINNEPLLEVLQRTWAEGFVLGEAYGDEAIARAREAKKADNPDYIDWDNWRPGDAATAALVRPPKAFQDLLGRARVTIKDLDQTGYDRVGTALADSIAQGLSDTRSARLINDAIGNPARALSIAITETNRAMSYGAISRYKAANLEQMEWETSDPCPTCAMNSGQVIEIGGTFNSGAQMPPAHPHCRCVLLPVIPEFEPNANGVVDVAPKTGIEQFEEVFGFKQFDDRVERLALQDYQMADPKFEALAFQKPGALGRTNEYESLRNYKATSYGRINDGLRTGRLHSDLEIDVKRIDKVMKAAPGLPEPIVTFRGLNTVDTDPLDQMFSAMRPGDSWVDKGYSSTTLSKEFAETFADGWLITVENPAGTKGVMLDGVTSKSGIKNVENEWLLPRGTDFEVISVDTNNKNMTVRVKQ
jgi:SPP1 gp7 family putative phage head morphogenesis protein